MKTYNRDDLIAELASNITVRLDGYGTWKVRTYVGFRRNPMANDSFITHNEADSIGEMDGEQYNSQDINTQLEWFKDDESTQEQYYNEWFENYDWSSAGWTEGAPDADSSEAHERYTRWVSDATTDDPIFQKIFDKMCKAIWSDSANSDNYEPYKDRVLRLAKQFVGMWDDGNAPNDVFVGDNGYYIFEDEAEQNVFDENIGYYSTQFNNGKFEEFNAEVERTRSGESFD